MLCILLLLYVLCTAVRVEGIGATFRGFAIQAREATPSFTNAAAFVGQFVNPASDWEIWNCAAVSRTCTNAY